MSKDSWKQISIFKVRNFKFPYLYRFPGQEKDEAILYATREAKITLYLRWIILGLADVFLIGVVWYAGNLTSHWWPMNITWILSLTTFVLIGGGLLTAYIFYIGWQKTIGIVTNFRLIKIVQFGLWHDTTQTMFLSEVTDTAADRKGMLRRIMGLSTFTAWSGAGSAILAAVRADEDRFNLDRKFFYLRNISNARDLEHYVQKVIKLSSEKSIAELSKLRPFASKAKTGQRDKLEKEYPEYWY